MAVADLEFEDKNIPQPTKPLFTSTFLRNVLTPIYYRYVQ